MWFGQRNFRVCGGNRSAGLCCLWQSCESLSLDLLVLENAYLIFVTFWTGQIDGQEITATAVLAPRPRPPPRRFSPPRRMLPPPPMWRRSPPRMRRRWELWQFLFPSQRYKNLSWSPSTRTASFHWTWSFPPNDSLKKNKTKQQQQKTTRTNKPPSEHHLNSDSPSWKVEGTGLV